MKTLTRPSLVILSVAIALLGLTSGCDDSQPYEPSHASDGYRSGTRSKAAQLASFETCDAVEDYVIDRYTDYLVDSASRYGYWDTEVDFGMPAPEAGNGSDDDGASGGETPGEYTDTNVQEAGVDEADIVKTDGSFIYFAQGNTLRVMKSFPPSQTALIAEVTIQGFNARLFLRGDTLIVLSDEYNQMYYPYVDYENGCTGVGTDEAPSPEPGGTGGNCVPEDPGPLGPSDRTRVTVFDVSDPAAPTLTASIQLQGRLIDTRRIDDAIYLVTKRSIAWNYEIFNTLRLSDERRAELEAAYRIEDPIDREKELDRIKGEIRPTVAQALAEADEDVVDSLMTRYLVGDGDPQTLVGCAELMKPAIDSESMSVLNVVGFDIDEPGALHGIGLVSDGWHVYASKSSLYVARDSRAWDWFASERPEAMTHIHRFLLDDARAQYAASGTVSGFIKDRYSFSEHDGYLRVATTDEQWNWWGGPVAVDDNVGSTPQGGGGEPASDPGESATDPSEGDALSKQSTDTPDVQANNLYVLEEDGESLNVVGSLSGYGENERIYAVRFMGERAYVVTFRQTDPLYTLDLSDPRNPSIAGELKITGFSNYLHPIGDGYLIGLGREADESGRVTGLQVQLFDVSDDENPTRISQYVLDFNGGWASSTADHDPHAFVWYPRRNLLAIPLTVENWGGAEPSSFAGLALFHITVDGGVEAAGRVSHADFVGEAYCDDGSGDVDVPEACYRDYVYYAQMLRSIFIQDPDDPSDENDEFGDFLYAISVLGMTVSNVDAPAEVLTRIPF